MLGAILATDKMCIPKIGVRGNLKNAFSPTGVKCAPDSDIDVWHALLLLFDMSAFEYYHWKSANKKIMISLSNEVIV